MARVLTLEWVRLERARLQAALRDLDGAERLLMGGSEAQQALPLKPAPAPAPAVNGSTNGAATAALPKKATMLGVIAKAAWGLTSQKVIEAATAAGIPNMNMQNTSPQLSGARKDGYLILRDGSWHITEKGREYLSAFKDLGGQP